MAPLLAQKKLIIADQYYSLLRKIGEETKATIVPSLSDKTKLIINNLTFYGKESYNVFLKSTDQGWQYLIFLSLSKFNGEWKNNIIHLGNYSISYLTVPKLFNLGMEAKRQNRLSSCVVYAWAMNKILRPAPYLHYIDEQVYIQFIKSSFTEMNSKFKFPFNIDDSTIIDFKIETTNNEGLIPIVLYLTDLDLNSPDIKNESHLLKDKVIKKFYGIDHDFDYLVMRAYNEMSTDPEKIYKMHGTVIKLKE